MKILLTGKNGQVGYELERSLQHLGTIVSLDRAQMDLANRDEIRSVIRETRPDIIINPAAYTTVDKAESEPDLAMLINGVAPGIMAEEAEKIGAAMIHYSTDYVFDGTKDGAYTENDAPNPLNVYGKSKLAGEDAVRVAGSNHLIFRTSWVYGARGKNFLQTILRLAKEREEIRIVNDQCGAPTWSRSIAEATAYVVAQHLNRTTGKVDFRGAAGVYHLTAQGATTWFGFAKTIFQNSQAEQPRLLPITTEQYPVAAPRPKNSKLSCELFMRKFCHLPDWESALLLCQQ
ncbi:dTDP-4-dehydrorhamnose reductase [Noviherbaspirillum pedocola]|uniref:dTDP-4-dehydrorhamnose reductase n=1 Tax=Noviherbaspirillum pedocola TaxID=2801341 RepID=A0A934SQ31_9BURK|nr:dTDP-4-dehydrorhamnose reductase [Noviherbaspirillum pedocola]MBK4733384.1 dTDP-4-dehydrorhamnose reductase [Noviherbaspirillum pedocola]